MLDYTYHACNPLKRCLIVPMTLNGSGVHDIARVLHISPTTVLVVLREAAAQTPEPRLPERILHLEMDAGALWADGVSCKTKSSNAGSGRVSTATPPTFLPLFWDGAPIPVAANYADNLPPAMCAISTPTIGISKVTAQADAAQNHLFIHRQGYAPSGPQTLHPYTQLKPASLLKHDQNVTGAFTPFGSGLGVLGMLIVLAPLSA